MQSSRGILGPHVLRGSERGGHDHAVTRTRRMAIAAERFSMIELSCANKNKGVDDVAARAVSDRNGPVIGAGAKLPSPTERLT